MSGFTTACTRITRISALPLMAMLSLKESTTFKTLRCFHRTCILPSICTHYQYLSPSRNTLLSLTTLGQRQQEACNHLHSTIVQTSIHIQTSLYYSPLLHHSITHLIHKKEQYHHPILYKYTHISLSLELSIRIWRERRDRSTW